MKHKCPNNSNSNSNSKDSQDHKDIYFDTTRKIFSQKITMCNMEALIFIFWKWRMGHKAHLRKQFKWMNTYGFIITLIKRNKPINYFRELNSSSFEQTWIPFTQICFVQNLVEIRTVVLKKKNFKFC